MVGALTLDPNNGYLSSGEKTVKLSALEYRLMELFMRHPNQLLTRSVIADACWQEPDEISDNAVEAQVKNLRKRIADISPLQWLRTRRGLGYILEGNPR